jgi:hypothetical protein
MWKVLSKWSDVSEFAGRQVAYTVNGGAVKFGIVAQASNDWSQGGHGFNLTRYKRPDEVSQNCALQDGELSKTQWQMRLTTKNERRQIADAVLAGTIRLEYYARETMDNKTIKGRYRPFMTSDQLYSQQRSRPAKSGQWTGVLKGSEVGPRRRYINTLRKR